MDHKAYSKQIDKMLAKMSDDEKAHWLYDRDMRFEREHPCEPDTKNDGWG